MDSQRQILDDLMGKNRNLPMSELRRRNENYTDPEVCKNWIISMCFNDLFPNTPHDEGPCSKRHDPIFKYQFENDESIQKLKNEKHYITDGIYYIEGKIAEIDGKIKAKKQLLEGGSVILESDLPKELQDRVEQIEAEIKKLQAQSATFGEQGNLDESEALAEEAERLRIQKEDMIRATDNSILSRDQKVCEICGAYQASNDTEKRIQTHLEGKIHQGFLFLRRDIERLRKRREDLKELIEAKYKEQKEREESRSQSKSKSKKNKKNNKKKKKKSNKSESRSRSRSNTKQKKNKSKKKKRSRSSSSD